jgi:hypothetical protein
MNIRQSRKIVGSGSKQHKHITKTSNGTFLKARRVKHNHTSRYYKVHRQWPIINGYVVLLGGASIRVDMYALLGGDGPALEEFKRTH